MVPFGVSVHAYERDKSPSGSTASVQVTDPSLNTLIGLYNEESGDPQLQYPESQ